MSRKLQVDEAILVYAARYAIGRRSGAATDIAIALRANREALGTNMAIRYAVEEGIARAEPADRPEWIAAAQALGMEIPAATATEPQPWCKVCKDKGGGMGRNGPLDACPDCGRYPDMPTTASDAKQGSE